MLLLAKRRHGVLINHKHNHIHIQVRFNYNLQLVCRARSVSEEEAVSTNVSYVFTSIKRTVNKLICAPFRVGNFLESAIFNLIKPLYFLNCGRY